MAIVGQGAFTQGATATAQTIAVPSNLDSLEVWNYTQSASGGATTNGVYFYWQRPYQSTPASSVIQMGDGTQGTLFKVTAGAMSVDVTAANAFVLYDPSVNVVGALDNGSTGISGLTAANPGVATVGSTTGMSTGNIVRLSNLNGAGQTILNGIDFSVAVLSGTTFSLRYTNTTSSTPSTAGDFRVIKPGLFYPKARTIVNITSANPAVITLSVEHGYQVGQAVRLEFPGNSNWGSFSSLASDPNRAYTITAIDTTNNTITIDANTTGFGTFRTIWQAITPPYSPAQVVPIGENTATALAQVPPVNILSDATVNQGFLGMTLASGALMPAGIAADSVFWRAIKADFGGL